jgi:two-component system, chemotaxis family, protein-glutamate methylesterase/glutaminase
MMRRPELIVIGTSVGGLNALTALLRELPAEMPVPIAIVQHRAVGDAGRLAAVLQDHSRLPIVEADDKMLLCPATVYLAPADYHLLIESRGLVALSTDAPVRSARPSIDVLFETAAEAYGPDLIAVLLTGASADGADGLASVKAHGGWAIVEDPASAECGTMPAAALAATKVDYVVSLPDIGTHLMTILEGSRA